MIGGLFVGAGAVLLLSAAVLGPRAAPDAVAGLLAILLGSVLLAVGAP